MGAYFYCCILPVDQNGCETGGMLQTSDKWRYRWPTIGDPRSMRKNRNLKPFTARRYKADIIQAIQEATGAANVHWRPLASILKQEGLDAVEAQAAAEAQAADAAAVEVSELGIRYVIIPQHNQAMQSDAKTSLSYLCALHEWHKLNFPF